MLKRASSSWLPAMRPHNERLLWLLVALAGAWIVWFGTANGVGISMDSITYLRGAEHIAQGDGYLGVDDDGLLGPVDHWPPLYSMTIAIPVAAGLPAVQAARLVNVLALFALLYLSALLVRRLAPDAAIAPVVAMLVILVAPTVLRNHLMAWSEAIFLPLLVAGFLKVYDYFARDRVRDLVAAGVCFGLAAVDRYTGVAFIAALAIALVLIDLKQRGLSRFVRPVLFVAVAGLPTAIWFVHNLIVASRAHDRLFVPQLLSFNHIRATLNSLSLWLLPPWVPFRVRVLCLLVVVIVVVTLLRRSRWQSLRDAAHALTRDGTTASKFWAAVGLCVITYLGFVLVTISFFDFDVNFDTRMMSPILVLAIAFLAVAGRRAFMRPLAMRARVVLALVCPALVLLAVFSMATVRAAHDEPAQYASDRWSEIDVWSMIESSPPDTPVYASSPYVTARFVGRAILPFPDALPFAVDARYRSELDSLAEGIDSTAYLLFYPNADSGEVTLDGAARSMFKARAVDSTAAVILYRIER